jgi:3-phenylpropionate/trans-cinnamate dioxygenase ferredoxin reductase subunit
VHPERFYAEHGVELVNDTVVALDPTDQRLVLASGEQMAFGTAIVATGAEPRRIDLPGADLAGIHYLRTVGDSLRLQAAIRGASRVAVIGAGWIGSEVAASARQLGADVILIEPAATPLVRVLGETIGGVFRDLHTDHGVTLRLGSGVSELRGSGAVEQVVLTDGREEAADVVVVGVGVTPRTDVVSTAGVQIDNGIVVDQYLETNVPGVFAAGDVANAWHPHYGRSIRVEHWANALNQGAAAGQNAAGRREAYTRLPYFFSDQYDLGLEYVGYSNPDDAVAIRGDLAKREFIAFWHRDGVVTAAMNVNVWDVVDDLKAVVGSATPVDIAQVTDPDVPLAKLV